MLPKDPLKLAIYKKTLSERKIGNNYKKGKKLSLETRKKLSDKRKMIFGWKHSDETKQKISIANKKVIHTKEWNEKMANAKKGVSTGRLGEKHPLYGKTGVLSATFGRKHTIEEKLKLKYKRAFRILPYKDSKPEKMMQLALILNGIKFEKHKMITDRLGFYHQVDIFIEPNICIEVDGDYWHRLPKILLRDTEVNHKLNLLGFFVIRIWEHDIKVNAQDCIINIMRLIKMECEN